MENIIFLGAGASKADGAPLQNELFNEYFSMIEEKITPFDRDIYEFDENKPVYMKIQELLEYFFKIYFGIEKPFDKIEFPTFEETLGILELAINRNESFYEHSETYNLNSLKYGKMQTIRLALILAMAQTIDYDVKKSNGNNAHSTLIENLQNRNNVAFISTNYDTLIDNAIIKSGRSIDYCFNATQNNSIDLYKIHGSLNWLYCPVCKEIITTGNKTISDDLTYALINAKCPKCGSLMEAIIIPPTFFKNYQNTYISDIWHKAELALYNTKKVIFCGYSFPDADIYVKYLLKRVEMLNQNNIEIYVVNNHANKSNKDKESEKSRYNRFFENKNKIIYTELSFMDFANNPFSILE